MVAMTRAVRSQLCANASRGSRKLQADPPLAERVPARQLLKVSEESTTAIQGQSPSLALMAGFAARTPQWLPSAFHIAVSNAEIRCSATTKTQCGWRESNPLSLDLLNLHGAKTGLFAPGIDAFSPFLRFLIFPLRAEIIPPRNPLRSGMKSQIEPRRPLGPSRLRHFTVSYLL